jgi:cell division protein FtsN
MERKGVPSEYMVCILSPDGSLDETASEIIKAGTSMDIIRTLNENGTVYMVGPFKAKAEAEKLAGKLIAADVKGISVEKQE